MSFSRTRRRQIEDKIDRAARAAPDLAMPPGGWIKTFRKALGMSASELAERLGVSRNSVYSSIQNEQAGKISLNQLDRVAQAMGGKLVYAIVPQGESIKDIVMAQANRKAGRIVQSTWAHMALEEQTEGLRSPEEMTEELAAKYVREIPRNFWR